MGVTAKSPGNHQTCYFMLFWGQRQQRSHPKTKGVGTSCKASKLMQHVYFFQWNNASVVGQAYSSIGQPSEPVQTMRGAEILFSTSKIGVSYNVCPLVGVGCFYRNVMEEKGAMCMCLLQTLWLILCEANSRSGQIRPKKHK